MGIPYSCRCNPTGKKCDPYIKSTEKPIIYLIGMPLSGKSIQAFKLAYYFHVHVLNTEDLIRKHVLEKTHIGKALVGFDMDRQLVPRAVIHEMLKREMCQNCHTSRGWLIDGYPNELEQAIDLEKATAPCCLVIYIEISLKKGYARLRGKLKKKLDEEEGYEDRRLRVEIINDRNKTIYRMQDFQNRIKPLLEHYKDRLLVIDGSQSIDKIFAQLKDGIDEVYHKIRLKPPTRKEGIWQLPK